VPVNYLGDFGGGAIFLAMGVLAALWEAQRSGRGQVVDAAIIDGTALLQATTYGLLASGAWEDERGVNITDTGAPFYDVYETADGRHMAVGAIEPQFYAEFVGLLFGRDEPPYLPGQHDRSRWPELRKRIAARFASRTQREWTQVFEGTDACVAPVLSMTEAPWHPQLAARGTFIDSSGIVQPAPAPRFSRTPGEPGPLARPGEHTREVLSSLGFHDTQQLIDDRVVIQR
jgi:alpha-methylacyl-CoA racemase